MPYSGADDPNLPANVKKMSKSKRTQWVSVFNSTHKKSGSDEKSFKTANGVSKSVREELSLREDYDDAVVEPSGGYTPSMQMCPTRIAAMMDEDAQHIWLETYNQCAIFGGMSYQCESAAWRAVEEAGYAMPTDKMVKVERASTGVTESLDTNLFMESDADVPGTGAIWDVILIKSGMSANRRRYSESTLRAAASLFEGVKAYADHPTKSDLANRSGNRSVTEIVGWYSNAHYDDRLHAIVAQFHVLESASWLRSVLLEIKSSGAPALLGLSINANGETAAVREGRDIIMDVTKITSVVSVDVVTEPAAGGTVVRLVASKIEEDNMDPEEIRKALAAMTDEQRASALAGISPTATPVMVMDPPVVAPPTMVVPAPVVPAVVIPPVIDTTQPAVDPALAESVQALREEMASIRIEATRNYASARLAESRLPAPFRERVKTRLDSLLERREATNAEIDAVLTETTDMWAAFENERSGKVSIPGSIHITEGDAPEDEKIKALDGMFANKDVDGVKRFRSIREAYAAWTGVSPFRVDPIDIFRESLVSYDSHGIGNILESSTTASWGSVFADRLFRRMVQEYNLPYLDDWKKVVSNIENVTDFRTQRRDRIGGYGLLSGVSEGATYPMLTSPSDEEATYAISKRGGLDDITFEMIVNDDLRNIRNIPVKLARAAKQTLFRFVFDMITDFSTAIYDGVALYHSSHNNIPSGAPALSDAGLTSGWQLMRDQTAFGNTTEKLGTRPKMIIVPNELEALAWRLANSAVSILSANYNATEPNFFKDQLEVIVVDYLTDANNWVLIADPAMIPTMEIGFLNGQEEPELFVQDQPNIGSVMTADKITYKVRHIYSGTILDFRSFVGSNPA